LRFKECLTTVPRRFFAISTETFRLNPQSQSFSRSYGSILPTSLIYILLIDHRLFILETWCGNEYDQECE